MSPTAAPFAIIYDNDMGNDIDDALALQMAALSARRGGCRLAAVVSSNPVEWSVYTCDAINRWYGLDDVPLGLLRGTVRFAWDNYTRLTALESRVLPPSGAGPVPEAVTVLRQALHAAADASVRVVATGFSTNLARLLASGPDDRQDGIPVSGLDLVRRKVQFLSLMAADFTPEAKPEFNVLGDIEAMAAVFEDWPTPIHVSDFAIGNQVLTPWSVLHGRLAPANPVRIAYQHYYRYRDPAAAILDRPSWDQTSMLAALEPDGGHFALSPAGDVRIDGKGRSTFTENPAGRSRLLRFTGPGGPQAVAAAIERYYVEP